MWILKIFFVSFVLIQFFTSPAIYSIEFDNDCLKTKVFFRNLIRYDHLNRLYKEIDGLGDWSSSNKIRGDITKVRFRALKLLLLKNSSSQAENVKAFEYFLEKMKVWTNGDWSAQKFNPADGSVVFKGDEGYAIIFKKNGKIFRATVSGFVNNAFEGLSFKYVGLKEITRNIENE